MSVNFLSIDNSVLLILWCCNKMETCHFSIVRPKMWTWSSDIFNNWTFKNSSFLELWSKYWFYWLILISSSNGFLFSLIVCERSFPSNKIYFSIYSVRKTEICDVSHTNVDTNRSSSVAHYRSMAWLIQIENEVLVVCSKLKRLIKSGSHEDVCPFMCAICSEYRWALW